MNKLLSFFKDSHGNWAVIQFPNPLLLTWLLLVIISMFITDTTIKSSINQLKDAVLFAWAYFEVTSGVSYFRRVLGGFIMIMIIIGYFG
ncbi:MAG: hypothetical protein JWN75_475 [Candidatus Saccharibacteria bacterium]|nr:hypothetical protein [Candidatus Saccharibacteria bacterium]